MSYPYPVTEPFDGGMLDVGDGHQVAWEASGNPDGKPAVLLHGGPGSGSSPRHRRLFDPERYLIVQFDQRMCGRSTPGASEPEVDLSTNTTAHLVDDIELLRQHLRIERWLVWGGSWGTTLALAYAQNVPAVVSGLVLGSVVTTSRAEVDWVTRSMGRIFPEAWRTFVGHLPVDQRGGDLAGAYLELLIDPDPRVHEPAALAWCAWEDTHVSLTGGNRHDLRDADPSFRLGFARLVTHYWSNAGFLPDGALLDGADRLADIPTFLAHGRADVSAPVDVPAALAERIAGAELYVAEHDGHGGAELSTWMSAVLDRLAPERRWDLGPDCVKEEACGADREV